MNVTPKTLYDEINAILKKNIDTRKNYLEASKIAKEPDVKLFLKNKAHNKDLFIKRLMSELNISTDSFLDKDNFAKDHHIGASDDAMLMDLLKTDKQSLMDFESLLKHPTLPFPIRLIINEQIIFIRLDELKREQLSSVCK